MTPFDFRPRTRVVFGNGEFARLGEIARELGATRCLLVADPGIVLAGYQQEAARTLKARRIEVFSFLDFDVNPTSAMVEAGAAFAAALNINLIVSVGGGSSMDCAKAINFLLTNGGQMKDYWGYGKATKPMLPMVAVPTTAGTGSEAQSFCVITDTVSQARMACGDAKVAFRAAILDPRLSLSLTKEMTAASGYDALSHALETFVTTRQTALSECFSRSAWRLVNSGLERVLQAPEDLIARSELLLGAHFGGLAVENSMLGAAHALAPPLTQEFEIPHGVAISLVMPHVVKWNSESMGHRYKELYPGDLCGRLRNLAEMGGLPLSLQEAGVPEAALPRLAEDAAAQWPGRFNPRTLDKGMALELYQSAYSGSLA
jgi:alcohol dehydrogenase